MSLSVRCSVVESFKFNDKSIRAFYTKDVGQCLISQDVYTAVGYDKENGIKTMQQLVPEKYKIRLVDAMIDMKEMDQNVHLHPDTVLLKEPDLYHFLLRCKRDEAEPFMEWVVETVLPWGLQKLASTIEEKDAVIALMNYDLQGRDNQIQAIKSENVALQAQRDVYQAQLQRCQDTITHLRTCYVDHARDPGKDNIIIIARKHTKPANDKFHGLPYYIARVQQRKRYVALRWFDQHFPDHEVIVQIDNPNSIYAFNPFQEEGHTERKCNHLRLIGLTQQELPSLRIRKKKNFFVSDDRIQKSLTRTGKDLTLFNFLHQPLTNKSCNKNN